MTRDDVLKEFGADEFVRTLPIAVAYPVKRIAEEVSTLRERLTAVEAERDALQQQVVKWWGEDHAKALAAVEAERDALKKALDKTIETALEGIEREKHRDRILAALREPSEAVVEAGCITRFGFNNWAQNGDGEDERSHHFVRTAYEHWRGAQRVVFGQQLAAAVAAAEADASHGARATQEVGDEPR